MAVTATLLDDGGGGTDATSYNLNIASAPTANQLLVCGVVSSRNGTITIPTMSGLGLTWQRVSACDAFCDTGANTRRRMAVFAALTGGSPSSGAITADYAGETQTGAGLACFEVTGADVSGTALDAVRQAASIDTTGATSLTANLGSAALSTSVLLTFCGVASNVAITHRTDWTETSDRLWTSPNSALETQSRAGSTDTAGSASWTGSLAAVLSVLELQEDGGGGGGSSIVRQMMQLHG